MNEERKLILEMVKNGTVTVEEAERLLEATVDSKASQMTEFTGVSGPTPKWLRILVSEDSRSKVNARIPFTLVKLGLSVAQRFVPQMDDRTAAVIQSIDYDELMQSLREGLLDLPYTLVDVDDNNSHVLVILE